MDGPRHYNPIWTGPPTLTVMSVRPSVLDRTDRAGHRRVQTMDGRFCCGVRFWSDNGSDNGSDFVVKPELVCDHRGMWSDDGFLVLLQKRSGSLFCTSLVRSGSDSAASLGTNIHCLCRAQKNKCVLMSFHILSCPSVRPPFWAGPDWTGFMTSLNSLIHFRITS